MNISLIAAIGKNNELGVDNKLIWHLKKDLQFFKKTTMGKNIIMGRNTFDSLPKMLPGRKHIVLSTTATLNEEIEIYRSIKEFLEVYKDFNEEMFVIGGAQIYKQFLEFSNNLYLTEINSEYKKADVYFPIFNKEEYNKIILCENEENNIKYSHVLYKKK